MYEYAIAGVVVLLFFSIVITYMSQSGHRYGPHAMTLVTVFASISVISTIVYYMILCKNNLVFTNIQRIMQANTESSFGSELYQEIASYPECKNLTIAIFETDPDIKKVHCKLAADKMERCKRTLVCRSERAAVIERCKGDESSWDDAEIYRMNCSSIANKIFNYWNKVVIRREPGKVLKRNVVRYIVVMADCVVLKELWEEYRLFADVTLRDFVDTIFDAISTDCSELRKSYTKRNNRYGLGKQENPFLEDKYDMITSKFYDNYINSFHQLCPSENSNTMFT